MHKPFLFIRLLSPYAIITLCLHGDLSTSVSGSEPRVEAVSSSEDSSVLETALEPDYMTEPAALPFGCSTEPPKAQTDLHDEPATATSTDSLSDEAVTAVQASEAKIQKWRAKPDSDSSDDVKTAIELYVPSDRDLMLLNLPASRRPPNASASINEEEVTRPLEGDYCPVRGMLSDRHLAFGGNHEDDSNESTSNNIFVTAFNVLKWTARLCYIVCCPPVPKKVIEKSVFFPPKRGRYYFLIGGPADNRQAFLAADKAYDQEDLVMCLTCFADKRYIGSVLMEQVLRLKVGLLPAKAYA
ncbi:hypothetical protein AAVH_11702 [Aphelenchoides avenae]|nr:hypothetical protein AAVH_11702 [Aphelenchus avenae]